MPACRGFRFCGRARLGAHRATITDDDFNGAATHARREHRATRPGSGPAQPLAADHRRRGPARRRHPGRPAVVRGERHLHGAARAPHAAHPQRRLRARLVSHRRAQGQTAGRPRRLPVRRLRHHGDDAQRGRHGPRHRGRGRPSSDGHQPGGPPAEHRSDARADRQPAARTRVAGDRALAEPPAHHAGRRRAARWPARRWL